MEDILGIIIILFHIGNWWNNEIYTEINNILIVICDITDDVSTA